MDVTGADGSGRPWRLLGYSFLAGAALDLPFGAAILLAPEALAPWLGVALPSGRTWVYFDLCGLFLLALGALYLLTWRAPRRLAPVAAVGALLRFGGLALFWRDVATGRADRFFLVVGSLEGLLGLVHLYLLRAAAGGLVAAFRARDDGPP